jgi:hypothetical protein
MLWEIGASQSTSSTNPPQQTAENQRVDKQPVAVEIASQQPQQLFIPTTTTTNANVQQQHQQPHISPNQIQHSPQQQTQQRHTSSYPAQMYATSQPQLMQQQNQPPQMVYGYAGLFLLFYRMNSIQ